MVEIYLLPHLQYTPTYNSGSLTLHSLGFFDWSIHKTLAVDLQNSRMDHPWKPRKTLLFTCHWSNRIVYVGMFINHTFGLLSINLENWWELIGVCLKIHWIKTSFSRHSMANPLGVYQYTLFLDKPIVPSIRFKALPAFQVLSPSPSPTPSFGSGVQRSSGDFFRTTQTVRYPMGSTRFYFPVSFQDFRDH